MARDEVREVQANTEGLRNQIVLGVYKSVNGALACNSGPVTSQITTGYSALTHATDIAPNGSVALAGVHFDNTRVAPTGPRIAPARYGVLPCVYLGS